MMTADAGLTMKTGLIIKIKTKMELKQINNGESGLSVRSKINEMFAHLFGLKIKVSDSQGYVPELEELNDGQSLINTADKRKYTRVGNKMYEQSIAPVVDFKIYLIDAPNVHSPSTGNAIQLSGTKLTGIEMEVENSENIEVQNANLDIINDNHASITYDLTGNIKESERISFLLSKGDTTVIIEVMIEVEVVLLPIIRNVYDSDTGASITTNTTHITIEGDNFGERDSHSRVNISPEPLSVEVEEWDDFVIYATIADIDQLAPGSLVRVALENAVGSSEFFEFELEE